ncbi:MAG: Asp-tRNA(Asn)/Glu-tRNA(Gln) amidotransferase subunit GatC [Patescibacteria group bacterium]|jgi:aspartyl-tRNA(Asn)/glutamyl-tRNA(Gln) amidotransferase subunit C
MLNIQEVEKLATLAKIELTAQEKEKFATEISSILGYVDNLKEIKVESAELTPATQNVLRADRVIGISILEQESLIQQAPETKDNLIKTKPVF